MVIRSDIEKIRQYVRAANYISAAQIYLRDNFLLERDLRFEDIKPRLLGHWGTCPGINFIYANLQYLIRRTGQEILFVNGVGHGLPALQANLFIEGTLEDFYPEAKRNRQGLGFVIKNFSWPYGFASHSNPTTPGVILEGGELGYSLATAYGAALDNPDLVVACVIGDGEAETGPLATSWHLNKFVYPQNNGIVLPILHLNGYKISGPTIFGRMSLIELRDLFYGYGYEPMIVEEIPGEDIFIRMVEVMDRACEKIREIKAALGCGKNIVCPRLPVIILKTPKGWTGVKELNGEKIEGNSLSHQVPCKNAGSDLSELRALQTWLKSYNFEELFDPDSGFIQSILDIVPKGRYRMGANRHVYNLEKKPLVLPSPAEFTEEVKFPGVMGSSSMRRAGEYLNGVISLNQSTRNFRVFSPDETYSNKLDKIFESTTRSFTWPLMEWDRDMSVDGRVIEMLSEHALFGLLQGYVLTGRNGVFVSYEAFVQIVSSMVDQYLKFIRVAREVSWRPKYPSLNIILTSSGWRQDHNGFSHQNPGFISGLIEKGDPYVNFYFPPDGNTTLFILDKAFKSENGINVIVAGKTQEPRWLDEKLAKIQADEGIMVWDFVSDDDPDLVLCAIGDYMTKEMLAAIELIKGEEGCRSARIRFVNVSDLSRIRASNLDKYFTRDKPVIINFHGYPDSIKKLLFDYKDTDRFDIRGFVENGSTTTPFDMQVRNHTSRWHIVIASVNILHKSGIISGETASSITAKYLKKLEEHDAYIRLHGEDMPEINEWKWGTRET